MTKQNLTRASGALFRHAPDERFPTLDASAPTVCKSGMSPRAAGTRRPPSFPNRPPKAGRVVYDGDRTATDI